MKTSAPQHLSSLLFLMLQILWFSAYSQGPSPSPYIAGNVPDCMKTNLLAIHTGVNWRLGTLYPFASPNQDEYWSVIHTDTGPSEYCAYSYNTSCPYIFPGSRAISETSFTGSSANNWDPVLGWMADIYTFRRHVWIDIPSTNSILCNLTLNISADDKLDEVRVNNIALSGVNTGINDYCDDFTFSTTATFHGGDNFIDFDIRNIDFSSGGTSSMYFDLLGWISCPTCISPIFINNNFYLPNTLSNMPSGACAASNVYDISPKFTGHCMAPPTTFTVSVTNVHPDAIYTLTSGTPATTIPFNAPFTFNGTLGETFTVTASLYGCDFPSFVTLTDDIPIVSLTTTNPCINFGTTTSSIGYSATAGIGPYLFSKVPSGTTIMNNPFYAPTVGQYTVQVTDAVGCTSTSTINIGNNFNISTTCINGPPCDYVPSPTYIFEVSSTPPISSIIGGVSCVWNSSSTSIPFGNQWSQASAAGIYSVIATDDYGCTASATYSIHTPPVITATSNAAPCNPILSYTSTNPPSVSQGWDDPNLTMSFSNPTYTPPLSVPASAGFYTVTVTDANGCTGSSSVFSAQDPFCCNLQYYSSTKKFSPLPLYNNGTASAILAAFSFPPGNVITTISPILLDGNIIIDVPISFVNCPDIRLTGLTNVIVNPGMSLTIDHSNLRSLCTYMWKGITATSNTSIIRINQSTLRDMSDGVLAANGAMIESTFNTYIDNFLGIHLQNAPVNYNMANLNCIITDNTFTSTNYFLLPPYNSQQKSETGLLITRCREVQIGQLTGGTSQNIFDNIFNGIEIRGGGMGAVEHYYVHNNYFKNIKSDFGTIMNETSKLATWASAGRRGVGIYSRPIGTPFPIPNHTMHLVNDGDNLSFEDCDKATVLFTTSAEMYLNIVQECLMGFMFGAATNQKFNIHDNNISEGLVGMRFVGNVGSSVVNNNWLYMRSTWSGGGFTFPIGIDVQAAGGGDLVLRENDIKLNSVAGSGITLRSTGAKMLAFENDIHINDYSGFPTTAPVIASGIFVEKANGSILQGNKLMGNTTLLTTNNSWDGARLSSSINCILDCNHFTKSKTGLTVMSNCMTGKTSVRGNTFNTHGIGMVFGDLGTTGTLDDIGSAANDNNNIFTNAALASSPTFVVGKGIFKWAQGTPTVLFPGKIFTNPANPNTISSGYSGSNIMLPPQNYAVQPAPTATTNPSCPPWAFMMMLAPGAGEPIDEEMAEEIATDNLNYPEFEEGSREMDRDMLYRALAGDSSVWITNTDLVNFMNIEALGYTDELYQIDQLFNTIDSTLASDSIAFMSRIGLIQTLNNSIVSTKHFDINVKLMNSFILKTLTGGVDSLSEVDREIIDTIAASCPFLNGSGVYKARVLQASFSGSINYDDWAICHSMGVYKNGYTNPFEIGIDASLLAAIEIDGIKIYPNPASNQITIQYSLRADESGKISLYDMMGRCIKTILLSASTNRIIVPIESYANGIYSYKYDINGKKVASGKFIKE